VEAGKLLGTLEGSRGRVVALAFSPDGQLLATAGAGEEGKSEVLLWDAKTWRLEKACAQQMMQVNALAFSPAGRTLAIGAGNPYTSTSDTGEDRPKTPGELRLIPLEPVDATPDGEDVVAVAQGKEAAGEIQDALRKAVAFLKETQAKANWESPQSPLHVGGNTALAVWALLEAGIATDDPTVAKGLDYLRTVAPESTYVVSLQTMVFCRAALNRDRELIKRNVDWLLAAMHKDTEGRCLGWSYAKRLSVVSDNSNTQYAVMALDAAAKADVEMDAAIWRQVKEYYLRVQLPDGGWAYTSRDPGPVSGSSTQTMTSAGVTGLAICRHQLKEKPSAAMDRGLERLAELYDPSHPMAGYYFMHGLSRAAVASGQAKLENKVKRVSFDWKQDIRRRLLKAQASNGSWQSTHPWESHPPLATSFAVLVLSTMR
jgi:hypothetical protein